MHECFHKSLWADNAAAASAPAALLTAAAAAAADADASAVAAAAVVAATVPAAAAAAAELAKSQCIMYEGIKNIAWTPQNSENDLRFNAFGVVTKRHTCRLDILFLYEWTEECCG